MATCLPDGVKFWGEQCFQSIGVTKDWRRFDSRRSLQYLPAGFQSIGVTKDWRHCYQSPRPPVGCCFQSIGITKDWRHYLVILGKEYEYQCFQSIGVTKDWRPPPTIIHHQYIYSISFQSIGVTKDWRPNDYGNEYNGLRNVSNQ